MIMEMLPPPGESDFIHQKLNLFLSSEHFIESQMRVGRDLVQPPATETVPPAGGKECFL